MALDEDAIRETLGNPRHTRAGVGMRELWTRDKLTAVVEPREGFWMVITFVWATANAWATDRETVQSRGTDLDRAQERRLGYAQKQRRRGQQR